MAAAMEDFEEWLRDRLDALDLDGEVFGSYLMGVLAEEDADDEETKDALQGILEGMTEHSVDEICSEVITKWQKSKTDSIKKHEEKCGNGGNKEDKLVAAMLETIAATLAKNVIHSKPSNTIDPNIKKQMMMMYSQESDEEEQDNHHCEKCEYGSLNMDHILFNLHLDAETDAPPIGSSIFKNTNTESILEKEKAKRDKLKEENDKKKLKNKEDREKQKQKVDDRKDKEKKRTQKGEKKSR